MKIALSFPGCHRRGGVERVMLESVNFLSARHETHAFASEWDEARVASAVKCHQVSTRPLIPALTVPAFARACGRQVAALKPDVMGGFGAVALPESVVWMTSVHATWIEISQQTRGWTGRAKQLLNPFHPIILRRERQMLRGRQYRKVIALTTQVRDDVMKHYDVPAEDIVIIANGFAQDEFNAAKAAGQRASMRQKLGYSDEDRVVIFVANELERKGFFPLLRAVAALKDLPLKLLAVGRLSEAACERETEELGLRGKVQFTGPSAEVADYFAAADVFALPTYYEAWGLVILEALACGLPVLTSRLAGAAITVQEGRTGELLDDPRDDQEIARKLRLLLERTPLPPDEISASVAAYQWSEILGAYERTLLDCAR